MPLLNSYDVVIFDCDGVILDSNDFKLSAMKNALEDCLVDNVSVERCVDYFRENFGLSRFHHIDKFVCDLIENTDSSTLKTNILENYSNYCKKSYSKCDETPSIRKLLNSVSAKKFVASGSAEDELRNVLDYKELSSYFVAIYGSPKSKTDIIDNILKSVAPESKVLMIGDSESDFVASKNNNIDFIFYSPFSNVKNIMFDLSVTEDFLTLSSWEQALL
tara:strand:- start:6773 stop:7429 length:657 start_codon:yes stop_codon:yes gene_type:complete